MSDASEVKPQYLWFCQKSGWQVTSFDPNEDEAIGFSGRKDTRLFINKETHDRIVAELRSEVAQAKREAADAMSGCCDCPMFKAQGKTVARQAKVIEKLKAAIEDVLHERYSDDDVSAAYSDPLMVLLTAIEKQGEGT